MTKAKCMSPDDWSFVMNHEELATRLGKTPDEIVKQIKAGEIEADGTIGAISKRPVYYIQDKEAERLGVSYTDPQTGEIKGPEGHPSDVPF